MVIHPHTQLIAEVIKKKGFKSFLEIGVHVPENNHHLIQCQFKIGVDPNPNSRPTFLGTSDEFFEFNEPFEYVRGNVFDCVFIDGDHWCKQVEKDFNNSAQCLNYGGVIFIHDTDPKEERFAAYPRQGPRRWNGDVYKFLPLLSGQNWDWRTPDIDANGITVVKRGEKTEQLAPVENYQEFISRRKELLKLCTKEEFDNWIL